MFEFDELESARMPAVIRGPGLKVGNNDRVLGIFCFGGG